MYKIAMEAIQLQSEGKVMTQTSRIMTVFCHDFSLSLLLTHSSTSPQASDQATLVWLNTELRKGIKEMPKQKLYAK